MLISSVLIAASALTLQADPTRRPREAFTTCLHNFVNSSVQSRKSAETFATEFPQQCQAEERAYREAMIARDVAARTSRTDAEQAATEEIEWARQNGSENFQNPQ